MKKLLLFLSLFSVQIGSSQTYQLLPDSCTFCMYLQSTGGNSWNTGHYELDPTADTLYMGNLYKRLNFGLYGSAGPEQPFAFRQVGNQLFGIVHDSINEFLIMDFDTQIGDTIYSLYSEGILYDAKVLDKDSIQVNGGDYHHFVNLEGIRYNDFGVWQQASWFLTWNERALCGYNFTQFDNELLGGVLYNIPFYFYVISVSYASPAYCTTDPLYNTPQNVSCSNCTPQTNSLDELNQLDMLIKPNPADEFIQISIQNNESFMLEILDATGKIHYSSIDFANSQEVDVSDLESGVYFAYLYYSAKVVTTKFVKI